MNITILSKPIRHRTQCVALIGLIMLCAGAGDAVAAGRWRSSADRQAATSVAPRAPMVRTSPSVAPSGRGTTQSSTRPVRITTSTVPAAAPTSDEKLLVDLVNVERSARGLNPVVWDGMLTSVARAHGEDMCLMGRASHNSSKDGADYGARLARSSYRARGVAENVAYNADVVKAHRALMLSPGHRHNILDPDLTAVGMAVVVEPRSDWVYVVEDFATPIANVTDAEAARLIRETLANSAAKVGRTAPPEDKALSRQLGGMVERMIASGSVNSAVARSVGEGWTLAFTSMDPAMPPTSALARAVSAESYALAISFRKTSRYPFGTYWAILFLKEPS